MSEQVSFLDTSCVPRGERLALWSQALSGTTGVLAGGYAPLHVDGYDAETIDGHIEATQVGDLKVCRIEATPHRIAQSIARPRRGVDVLLQISGASVVERDGRRIETAPGDCLVGDLSRSSHLFSPMGTKHLLVIISGDTARSCGFRFENPTYQRFSTSRGLGRFSRDLVETILEDRDAIGAEHEHELAEMVVQSLQLSLAAAGAQFVLGARQRLVQRAKAFIDKNLRDPDLDLHKVAAALNCSARYLHTAFAEDGATITKYIWSARLDLCRRELMRVDRNEKSITDVAFACGFNSSSHFSRTFKQKFGVSPSKLRG